MRVHVINYITVQIGVRGMAPSSLRDVYLPAIKWKFMRENWKDTVSGAINTKEVRLIIKGFERFYRRHNPAANTMKVAYGMDLALRSQGCMDSVKGPHREVACERMFVIQAVGIMFMLRRSEHVYYKDGKRPPLLRRHVVFWDEDGKDLPYESIGPRRAIKVSLNVTFSKTDHSGFGRRPAHMRQDSRRDACIVCILEKWVAMTRDHFNSTEDMGLYEVPGLEDVSMEQLHEVMEATVARLGVMGYGQKATSHSLRYGGATMMAGAGFPQYLIAHYGGWTRDSKALHRYARPSEASIQSVSEAMTRMAFGHVSKHYIEDLIIRNRGRLWR